MAGLLLGGLVAYRLLPVAALPNVNYPTIAITAQFPGADPQTMAATVATPLEQQLTQIPGVTQMSSISRPAILPFAVQRWAMRYSAQSMASRQVFGLVSFWPARCQPSPSSPPPRTCATANTPPRSSQGSTRVTNAASWSRP